MRFWDTSAIVPCLVHEGTTARLESFIGDDPAIVAWWATLVECASAIRRREREGILEPDAARDARAVLAAWNPGWDEIQPAADVRDSAIRLVSVHALRATDALQLAAALKASGGRPSSLPFVCLDRRLADAAAREGLEVIPFA